MTQVEQFAAAYQETEQVIAAIVLQMQQHGRAPGQALKGGLWQANKHGDQQAAQQQGIQVDAKTSADSIEVRGFDMCPNPLSTPVLQAKHKDQPHQ